jgi:hypothetical protein
MIRLLFTILHRSVSGSFCDAGLKKLATALPVFGQQHAKVHKDEVSLVVVESSLRFTAGGDRGLLEDGERGRFPARGADIATAQSCRVRRGKAVHRDDALMKWRVTKNSSFNPTCVEHAGVASGFEELPPREIDNNS